MKKQGKLEALELAVRGIEELLESAPQPTNQNDMFMLNKFWTALTITKADLSARKHEMVEQAKKLTDVNKPKEK